MTDHSMFFHNIVFILLSVCKLSLIVTVCAKKSTQQKVVGKPSETSPKVGSVKNVTESRTPEDQKGETDTEKKAETPKSTSKSPKEDVDKKESKEKEKEKEKSKEKEKEKAKESKEKEKESKEKENKDSKEKNKEVGKSKKEQSKRDKSARKDKSKKQTLKTEETKKTEDKQDPRRGWALKVAQVKCSQLSKLHREKIKGYKPTKVNYKTFDANINLNRYADVCCIEETRVILKGRENDYIHASWTQIPESETRYILTQGPLPNTFSDFWAMIYQEKCKYILMLCPLVEGGVEKCSQYFPGKEGAKEKYGNMEVTFTKKEEEPVEGVGSSVMSIVDTDKPDSPPLECNHIYVPWWPDQLAPEDPKPMLKLYRWVKKMNPDNAPIVVHCSAGVGRTATFVGIDYATVRIQQDPDIEMVDIVHELRNMRFQAVQSHVQFLFLHVCLLELFAQDGIVERELISGFMEEYKKHANKKLQKRKVEEKDKSKD